MHLQLETTNHCNLQCVECPTRFMKRKRHHMNKDVFKAIVNNYINHFYPITIIMHKDGEPLLHPNFAEMIKDICSISLAKIDIYTNGIYLTEDLCGLLSTYKNRFDVLVSFHFFNYKGEPYNYSDVEQTLKKCISLNVPNINFIFVTHLTDFTSRGLAGVWKNCWESFQEGHPNLRAIHVNDSINPWGGLIKQKEYMASFSACPYADGAHLFIGVTGNVLPCCVDLEEEIVFGNVISDSRELIMDKRNLFYEKIRRNILKDDLCKRCLK